MLGRKSRYAVFGATALTVLVVGAVGAPAQATGADFIIKYKLPTDVAGVGGLYFKSDLLPDGEVVKPREPEFGPYVVKPKTADTSTVKGGVLADASFGTALPGGGLAGSGRVDPVMRAENSMRKTIRSLD